MDLKCTNCGEPWEFDYVVHEDPLGFLRSETGAIVGCPVCPTDERGIVTQEYSKTEEATMIRELHSLLGDDLDGVAAMMEDYGL